MAELSAIALVGNVLQFVEVGIKLTRAAQRAYKSTSGLIQGDEALLANTELLQTLADRIKKARLDRDDSQQVSIDTILLEAAETCDDYASELIKLLGLLRRRPGENRALETIRSMISRRLRNSEIQALEVKLTSIQKTLLLALTTSSHAQESSALVTVRELKRQNAVLEANTTAKLASIEHLIRSIDVQDVGASNVTKTIVSYLDSLHDEAQHVKMHQEFLNSLRCREIKRRHSAIQDHHKATFSWVLTENKVGLRSWLANGHGVFWVKGKAGSGKSTLMKFVAAHEDTQKLLQTWGKKRRVIIASHFFWNAGLPMQKSLTGLLRTILFQVLRECPELIALVNESQADFKSWDVRSLLRAFEKLSSQQSLPLRFCFFIDGLDEYTAGAHRYTGTFEELFSPLRVLASSDSIKICVSSRPWGVFDREFSHVKFKLQLEDLTRGDIRNFVEENLEADPKFQELSQADHRCSGIKNTIVQRARGVFLWVCLVVNSLKRGLLKDDNYSDLQKRLNELPDDLQEYFERILQCIETVYWDSATRIFRTILAAEQSLPLLAFEFLDRELNDPNYPLTMDVCPLTDSESEAICKRYKTRLDARCGDLLYVTVDSTDTGLFKNQVDFLHRTVRDFFLDAGVIEKMIQRRPTKRFDPHLSLCRIMLGLIKAQRSPTPPRDVYIEPYSHDITKMYLDLLKAPESPTSCLPIYIAPHSSGLTGTQLDLLETRSEHPGLRIRHVDSKRFDFDQFDGQFILSDRLMDHARHVEENSVRHEDGDNGGCGEESLGQVVKLLDELDRSNSKSLERAKQSDVKPRGYYTDTYGQEGTFISAAIQARLCLYLERYLRKDPPAIQHGGGQWLLDNALQAFPELGGQRTFSVEQGPVLPIVELLLKLKVDPNRMPLYMERNLSGITLGIRQSPWERFLKFVFEKRIRGLVSGHLIDAMGSAIQLLIAGGARTDIVLRTAQNDDVRLEDILDMLGLSRHQKAVIEELIEIKRQERPFLARFFEARLGTFWWYNVFYFKPSVRVRFTLSGSISIFGLLSATGILVCLCCMIYQRYFF